MMMDSGRYRFNNHDDNDDGYEMIRTEVMMILIAVMIMIMIIVILI